MTPRHMTDENETPPQPAPAEDKKPEKPPRVLPDRDPERFERGDLEKKRDRKRDAHQSSRRKKAPDSPFNVPDFLEGSLPL